jgi:phosphopantetheinyl transferase (holo-ACP synthase)
MKDIVIRPGHDSLAGFILDPTAENGQTTTTKSAREGFDDHDLSGQEVLLSISHEREYAIATAIVPA